MTMLSVCGQSAYNEFGGVAVCLAGRYNLGGCGYCCVEGLDSWGFSTCDGEGRPAARGEVVRYANRPFSPFR